jgi:hypothetical protein
VVDGQIVVDQQSLTASAQASNPVVSQHYRRVEESGSRLNSNTYSNRKPTKRWTDADTVVFYKVRHLHYLFSGCEVCCGREVGLGEGGRSSGRPLTFWRVHSHTRKHFLGRGMCLRDMFRAKNDRVEPGEDGYGSVCWANRVVSKRLLEGGHVGVPFKFSS